MGLCQLAGQTIPELYNSDRCASGMYSTYVYHRQAHLCIICSTKTSACSLVAVCLWLCVMAIRNCMQSVGANGCK